MLYIKHSVKACYFTIHLFSNLFKVLKERTGVMEIQKDVKLKRAAREFLGKMIEDDINTITDFTQLITWIQKPNIETSILRRLEGKMLELIGVCTNYQDLADWYIRTIPVAVKYQIREKMFELNSLQLPIDNYDELLKRYIVVRCGHKIKSQLEEAIVEYVKSCTSYHGLRKLFLESKLSFETQKQIIERTIELDKVCNNLDELMRRWYESENCYSADVRHNLETRIIEKVVEDRNVVINLFKKSKCPYFLEKYLKGLAEQILQC